MSARRPAAYARARERGAASALVLGVLTALSALFVAAAVFVEAGTAALARARGRDAEQRQLSELASAVVALLLDDPTPDADSPFDPVWSAALPPDGGGASVIPLPQTPAGYSVELEDLSSRLGINWARKELLADLGVLLPGSADTVQQFREDTGLHLDLGAYRPFVGAGDPAALLTTYGWFNVNICDEFALRKVALARTSDLAMAEDLRGRVQQARIRKTPQDPLTLIGAKELAGFLGPAYNRLFPVVCAEPAMNVHFVPARVVETLFRHYNADRVVGEEIVARRLSHELDARQVEGLLGDWAKTTPLAHYLGVRTWFWRVTARGPALRLTWVLARMPGQAGARDERMLRVLEEQWAVQ